MADEEVWDAARQEMGAYTSPGTEAALTTRVDSSQERGDGGSMSVAVKARPRFEAPGIYGEIPEEEYHASPGLSQSALKILGEEGGPAKFRYGVRKETRPLKLGSLVHSLLLRPNTVMQNYRVTRLMTQGTKAWLEEEAAHPGRTMVKQAEFDKAMAIVEAVYRWSSVARELLLSPDRIMTECSFYWTDPELGLLCRGRADAAHEDFHVLLDLKSAQDASTDGFRRAVRDYSYHLQAAHYLAGWPLAGGWKPVDFVFIVVTKEPPYLCANYVLDPEDIQDGRDELRRLIAIYQHCAELDEWPGFDAGISVLPPIYRKRD